MKRVTSNSKVKVNYTGKLEDGTIFDSSLIAGREPLMAILGEGQLIKGFENGLLEMSEGESRTIEIEPDDAYGHYISDMVAEIPKDQVPENSNVGDSLQGNSPQGPIVVRITEIKEDSVIIDANHPLAGKKLIFDLEVISVD
jgi:FKBP-type peptidyl-prolyl cis-trans isomerase SlpA